MHYRNLLLLILVLMGTTDPVARYQHVQAFAPTGEILALPSYSRSGILCEVVLQKRAYANGAVDVDYGVARKDLERVLNELSPLESRGKRTFPRAFDELSIVSGNVATLSHDYANVSISFFATEASAANNRYAAAVLKWKRPECQ